MKFTCDAQQGKHTSAYCTIIGTKPIADYFSNVYIYIYIYIYIHIREIYILGMTNNKVKVLNVRSIILLIEYNS